MSLHNMLYQSPLKWYILKHILNFSCRDGGGELLVLFQRAALRKTQLSRRLKVEKHGSCLTVAEVIWKELFNMYEHNDCVSTSYGHCMHVLQFSCLDIVLVAMAFSETIPNQLHGLRSSWLTTLLKQIPCIYGWKIFCEQQKRWASTECETRNRFHLFSEGIPQCFSLSSVCCNRLIELGRYLSMSPGCTV